MTVYGCDEFADAAAELALGLLTGGARAEALLHLAGCAHCQAVAAEFGATADALLVLAPEIEPPAGFGVRTVDAMTGSVATRRRRLRVAGLVAAAIAAASIVSITVVRVVDRDRVGTRVEASAPETPRLRSATMVGGGGLAVGRVIVNGRGDRVALTVTVDYAVPDGSYAITVGSGAMVTGGRPIGTMTVASGRGWWSGVALVAPHNGWVALVDGAGNATCEGSFADLQPATS